MGFLPGEGLPYGIPSWGTFAIWYNFWGDNLPWYLFPHHEICVGGRFTIEGEVMVLFPPPPWGSSAMGFFRGNVCHMVYFPAGGGGGAEGELLRGKNSHVTPVAAILNQS